MLHLGTILESPREWRYSAIDFIEDADAFVVGTTLGSLYFYRLHDNGSIELIRPKVAPDTGENEKSAITCLKASPCGKLLAFGNAQGFVYVFELNLPGLCYNKHHEAHKGAQIQALAWRFDSCALFSGCSGGVVIEFSVALAKNLSSGNKDFGAGFLELFGAGKDTKRRLCTCAKPVHDLSCSVDIFTSEDLLLVSSDSHAFLFRIPRNSEWTDPNSFSMREVSDANLSNSSKQDKLWTESLGIPCGASFISNITGREDRREFQKFAKRIVVFRKCSQDSSSTAMISINHFTDEQHQNLHQNIILQSLEDNLESMPDEIESESKVLIQPVCFRKLVELEHEKFNNLLIALSDANNFYFINLQHNTFQKATFFDQKVRSIATSKCRVLSISSGFDEKVGSKLDFFHIFAEVASSPSIKIFPKTVYPKILLLQRKFRPAKLIVTSTDHDSVRNFLDLAYGIKDKRDFLSNGIEFSSRASTSSLYDDVQRDLQLQRHIEIVRQSRPVQVDEFTCVTSMISTQSITPEKLKCTPPGNSVILGDDFVSLSEYMKWHRMWTETGFRNSDEHASVKNRLSSFRKASKSLDRATNLPTTRSLRRISSRGEEVNIEPSFVECFSVKQVDNHRKGCRRRNLDYLLSLENISDIFKFKKYHFDKTLKETFDICEEISPNLYQLEFEDADRQGLGLKLDSRPGENKYNVTKFNLLANGCMGPVELSGYVAIGDELVSINDIDLRGKQPEKVASIVSEVIQVSKKLKLKFAYGYIPSTEKRTMTFSDLDLSYAFKSNDSLGMSGSFISKYLEADYNTSCVKFAETRSILIPDRDTNYTRALHCAGVKTFRHGYRYLLRTSRSSRSSTPSISSLPHNWRDIVKIPELLYTNTELFSYTHEIQTIFKALQHPIKINLRNLVQLEWYSRLSFPDDYEITVTERGSSYLRNHRETLRRDSISREHFYWISFWSNKMGYPKSFCRRLKFCNSSIGSENFVKLNLSDHVSWNPSLFCHAPHRLVIKSLSVKPVYLELAKIFKRSVFVESILLSDQSLVSPTTRSFLKQAYNVPESLSVNSNLPPDDLTSLVRGLVAGISSTSIDCEKLRVVLEIWMKSFEISSTRDLNMSEDIVDMFTLYLVLRVNHRRIHVYEPSSLGRIICLKSINIYIDMRRDFPVDSQEFTVDKSIESFVKDYRRCLHEDISLILCSAEAENCISKRETLWELIRIIANLQDTSMDMEVFPRNAIDLKLESLTSRISSFSTMTAHQFFEFLQVCIERPFEFAEQSAMQGLLSSVIRYLPKILEDEKGKLLGLEISSSLYAKGLGSWTILSLLDYASKGHGILCTFGFAVAIPSVCNIPNNNMVHYFEFLRMAFDDCTLDNSVLLNELIYMALFLVNTKVADPKSSLHTDCIAMLSKSLKKCSRGSRSLVLSALLAEGYCKEALEFICSIIMSSCESSTEDYLMCMHALHSLMYMTFDKLLKVPVASESKKSVIKMIRLTFLIIPLWKCLDCQLFDLSTSIKEAICFDPSNTSELSSRCNHLGQFLSSMIYRRQLFKDGNAVRNSEVRISSQEVDRLRDYFVLVTSALGLKESLMILTSCPVIQKIVNYESFAKCVI